MQPSIEPLGDTAAIVKWKGLTSYEALLKVHALSDSLQAARIPGIVAVVPAFESLTVHYDPCLVALSHVEDSLRKRVSELTVTHRIQGNLIEIPVCYDLELAVDLSELAQLHGMPVNEVVRLHSTADYVVQMIGFAPGFPYLSGLPQPLETARRITPRLRIPTGSVAIGGPWKDKPTIFEFSGDWRKADGHLHAGNSRRMKHHRTNAGGSVSTTD